MTTGAAIVLDGQSWDPATFQEDGGYGYLRPVTVGGVTYIWLHGSLAAALRELDTRISGAFRATSNASLSVGTGTRVFTGVTPGNRPFSAGGAIRATAVDDASAWMEGTVTSYDSGTNTLTVDIQASNGSGTFANWSLSVTAGQQGPAGPQGAQGIAGSGSGPTWQFVSTTVAAAVAGYGYIADTSGGAFAITLPASPVVGTQIAFADAAGTFATNNLTVARNGNTINGTAADLICDVNRASFALVWSGSTWRIV